LRQKWVYNVGAGGTRGAEIIVDLARRHARDTAG
jgi:hypothetical protein